MSFKRNIPGYLCQNFQTFYREVLIQRELAKRSTAGDLCEKIQRKLRFLLEQFAANSQAQSVDFTSNHAQESLYIMVALADEVFLSFNWPGQKKWEENLLEAQFFHTQIAGEVVYTKIEALLQANDPTRHDLAVLYLMALSLGFQGKYRGVDDEGRLAWYRHQLYLLVNHQPSDLYTPGREFLISDCYDHIQSVALGRGLPDVRSWLIVFACIIGGYVFISSTLWYKITHDLNDSVSQIITQARQLGLS